jgi:hypothetical protein
MRRKRFCILALALTLTLILLSRRDVVWSAAVAVNSTTDVSDGDTSSIANLIANPGADGVISLREAIEAANNTPGADTITFNIPDCGGVCTIQPLSALPTLTGGDTTIDGYTQPGAAEATDVTSATLLIEIDKDGAHSDAIYITSAGNVIRGLVINRAVGGACGIRIEGSDATGNIVSGNYIGTDASGTIARRNNYGVCINAGAQNNTIGGDAPADRNVISASYSMGIQILDSDTSGNTVCGNYIGTDANGTAYLGNRQSGVFISDCAHDNIIGGDTPGERNVISGNGGGSSVQNGVYIGGTCTTGNIVSGNYIGTDASGTTSLRNAERGVYLAGAQNNTIGGDAAGERNIISGNGFSGVEIAGGATNNTVSGNYIGTDASGMVALGNGIGNGVRIYRGTENNTIGGDTPGERNVISGNDYSGVLLLGDSYGAPRGNIVSGNYIGIDASGTGALPNNGIGIQISGDAQDNTIGPGNVIAHNSYDGVGVNGSSTTGNTITQNSIYANEQMGIDLTSGANGDIAAPVIAGTVGAFNVVGTACPGCIVEVFENGDTDGEGENYVGKATANTNGDFSVTIGTLLVPYLTATATDAVSGTSEFSGVFAVTERFSVYVPIVLNTH